MRNPGLAGCLIFAARYALTRRTYAPALVCDQIRVNIGMFSWQDVMILERDIEAYWAENKEVPADDETRREWMRLLEWLREHEVPRPADPLGQRGTRG